MCCLWLLFWSLFDLNVQPTMAFKIGKWSQYSNEAGSSVWIVSCHASNILLEPYLHASFSSITVSIMIGCFYLFIYLIFVNTIFVSSQLYPENPEWTQVIVGSMNMGYISDTARNRTHNLFHPKQELIPLGHSDGCVVHFFILRFVQFNVPYTLHISTASYTCSSTVFWSLMTCCAMLAVGGGIRINKE